MPDSKNKKDYCDRIRINMNSQYEVEYWTHKFGISTEELKKTVASAGIMVRDIKRYLKGE